MKPWEMMRRFGPVSSGGGTSDPHFAKVALLLHFEGANNSTSFIDSSGFARTGTAAGAAKLSTSSPLTGGASGVFTGAGDYVQYPHNTADNVGTGAFCIEAQAALSSFPAYTPLLGKGAYDIGYGEWTLFVGGNAYLSFYYGIRGTNQAQIRFILPTTLVAGESHKFCVRRDNDANWAAYLDGVKCAEYQFSPPAGGASFGPVTSGEPNNALDLPGSGGSLWVAAHPDLGLTGKLDELRFTVGEGRYTGSYTPDSGQFPDN